MIKRYTSKKAFTLLELIVVTVILGIVASIGSSVIANVYENYILQRATHKASLKTEIASQQIANLLSYRIHGTTLARNPSNVTDNRLVTDPTNATDTTHTLLEWIGSNYEGFSAAEPPPWSGFCDVAASSQTSISTPGSDLSEAATIFNNLASTNTAAIFFRTNNNRYSLNSATSTWQLYEVLRSDNITGCMGMVNNDTSCISTVTIDDDVTLDFSGGAATSTDKVISEHYKLALTAYSIRPVNNSTSNNTFDLELCYNYQPWEGERLTNNNCPGTSSTIITNVSVFKFAESGSTFRFKLCSQENIGEDFNITICKEKAVTL
jgi:prepilin-type N-terminal cleavage/methylation domain-containing protein